MKKQVLVIQGGTSFNSYEDYLSYLKKDKEINLDRIRIRKTWKNRLDVDLSEDFEVFLPEMPNRTNIRYLEWKIWFERVMALLSDNLILIGHSMGGIFLVKYLSENIINKEIKGLIIISAPFNDTTNGESFTEFKFTNSFDNLKQCKNIYLIQSKDDIVVPFEEVEKYKKVLPEAKLITFDNKGHFNQETFPELVELIKKN